MNLATRPVLAAVFSVGLACASSCALAAGGGASSGGGDAQNHPANGLPPGEAGPPGANNNPRGTGLAPDARNDGTTTPLVGTTAAPAHQ